MHLPSTDAYEIRKKVVEIGRSIGDLGLFIMEPTDESIHPEVRGVMAGYAASAGIVLQGLLEVTGCITDVGFISK